MDKNTTTITKLKEIISDLTAAQDVELVDVELKGSPGNQVLRVFVDVEGGISLKLCAELSRDISDALDTDDIIPGRYRLEVSSPGTDRPLRTIADFRRNKGRRVSVSLIDGKVIEGYIREVTASDVLIDEGENEVQFSVMSVKLAKIILEFKKM